jgi:hypothetical protein
VQQILITTTTLLWAAQNKYFKPIANGGGKLLSGQAVLFYLP